MTEYVTIAIHTNKDNNDITKNISQLDDECKLSIEPAFMYDHWIVTLQIDEVTYESLNSDELVEMFGFDPDDIDFIDEL
jgi:hypothetical protein